MNLKNVFQPQSIAVVGASTKIGAVGNDIVKNLVTQGYQGKIFPVNPKANELYGLKCFASLTAIGDTVDLVIIVVPAIVVPTVLEEAGRLGISAAVVISAGFKEMGQIELENQLQKISQEYGVALIGPNCLGVINPEIKMNASFANFMPAFGPVAFISQSGALCAAVIDYAAGLGIGFSKFISVGNKAVVDEVALLEYLLTDDTTKVVAMYVEQLRNPVEIIDIVKKMARGKNPKPIILLKSGRTSAGALASASHTGALAGNDAAYDALCDQSGIIRANCVSELFEYIQVFSNNNLSSGRNTAIITNAGGPGVLTTDEIIADDLRLAKLEEKTTEELKKVLPPAANCHNPIDVLGDARADRYAAALNLVVADKNVDNILVLLTPQSTTEIEETAEEIIKIKKVSHKPMAVSFMGDVTMVEAVKKMRSAGVTVINFPEQAGRALAALVDFSEQAVIKKDDIFADFKVDKKRVAKIFQEARVKKQTSFPEVEALEILQAYGFPLLYSKVAKTVAEAERVAKEIGGKLVMKIVSPDILHKSDVGGVMLGVEPNEVGVKFTEMMAVVGKKMPQANLVGVLLVEMAENKGAAEMILGVSRDPGLGSMIMVGLGGVYVEIFKDVSFGLAPITKDDAVRMVEKLKANKILLGARGQGELDREMLLECLGRLSQLLIDFPEIKELDINPLLVFSKGKGVKVLDARVVIE